MSVCELSQRKSAAVSLSEPLMMTEWPGCRSLITQSSSMCIKGIVHPTITVFSSFTHPHVFLNLYEAFKLKNIMNVADAAYLFLYFK